MDGLARLWVGTSMRRPALAVCATPCLGVNRGRPVRAAARNRPLHGNWLVTGRAGGRRDGDGRSGAAVRAAVASLPGRPRPAPQRQGGHGVVPPAAAGAGRRRRSSLPLARPGPAVGPGGQRAGGVPLPRRPSVRGAAGGDRGGPLRTEPVATLAGWTTAPDLAALPARRGGCAHGAARASRGDGFGLERSGRGASAGSTGHMEHAMTAPSAWFQTGITSGVGSSCTWQRWRWK
jgi:hypothetical protein